eukprot:6191165-Pleurochrysis_carterae.AAC.1
MSVVPFSDLGQQLQQTMTQQQRIKQMRNARIANPAAFACIVLSMQNMPFSTRPQFGMMSPLSAASRPICSCSVEPTWHRARPLSSQYWVWKLIDMKHELARAADCSSQSA